LPKSNSGRNGNHGNAIGVLDARGFGGVIDALLVLRGSPAFAAGMKPPSRLVQRLSRWLTTAKNANGEHAAKNNHGSWSLAQIIRSRATAAATISPRNCARDKMRIASQFKPDGSQPEEIRRVDGLGYSQFNLEAQFQVAHLATPLGSICGTTPIQRPSLRRGLEYLRPYNAHPETWPAKQNAKLAPGFSIRC